ncbi:MAG: amidohydrolase [Burkholderiaceae bacterium]|jgi:hippurate hydrolase|nr:amidohydrolase [Burkholderiaceae bacterium]
MTAVLASYVEEMRSWRHDIHQHPEIGFQETRTSGIVAQALRSWGYEVETGIGKTGVVGRLVNGSSGKSIGLRADMDALPIQEKTGALWQSKRMGMMHACGHDGHTAMLLGAAHYLADTRKFSGTVNLIFQPAEEGLGGAVAMMNDGLFDRYPCDAIFAMHNMPGIPEGQVVLRKGAFMASSDYATVTVKGAGGHGGLPHQATDSIVAASAIVMAIQTIVSRNTNPLDMSVITVGAINGGQANNVIPDEVKLEISIRSLSPGTRQMLERRLREVVSLQAQSYGVTADIDYRYGYPVLINHDSPTEFAAKVAASLLGDSRVSPQGQPLSGSEDFAYMLERIPGSYLLVGNGDGQGSCMVHNPAYDFNDKILQTGATLFAGLVESYLPS